MIELKIFKHNFYEYDDVKMIMSSIVLSIIGFITFTLLGVWKLSIIFGVALLCLVKLQLSHELFILIKRSRQ